MKMSRIVFLTGENIGADASETQHLYRRIVSFRKCSEVAVITQEASLYAEKAGCQHVVHLTADRSSQDAAVEVVKQADMLVIIGMSPGTELSASLLNATCSECNIAIISNGNMALPKNLHREHVVRMRDMSVGTGLLFLSMYHWLKDLIEE